MNSHKFMNTGPQESALLLGGAVLSQIGVGKEEVVQLVEDKRLELQRQWVGMLTSQAGGESKGKGEGKGKGQGKGKGKDSGPKDGGFPKEEGKVQVKVQDADSKDGLGLADAGGSGKGKDGGDVGVAPG